MRTRPDCRRPKLIDQHYDATEWARGRGADAVRTQIVFITWAPASLPGVGRTKAASGVLALVFG